MPSILLHACCAPCSTYTVNYLREQGWGVTAFWYNPNIHPFVEHRERLNSMKFFSEKVNLPLIVVEGYDIIRYFRAVVGHEGNRCGDCYRMRLQKTAEMAREKEFDAFTTTLLISPYQNQELITEIGKEMAREFGVDFHYEDFRDGFRESQHLALEFGLYRQKYCGCVYSEWERYGKVKIAGDKVLKLTSRGKVKEEIFLSEKEA